MAWIALPLLVLLPGAALLLCFGPPRAAGAFLWRAGIAGLLIASWCALALAQLSLLSVGSLAAVLAAGSLAILMLRRRDLGARWGAIRKAAPTRVPAVAALALGALVLAAALAARPGEYFGGGWDPGTYLAAGASIAHSGGLIVKDPLLASLDANEKDLLFPAARTQGIKYPGFYVHDLAAGTLIPQFQPLYPVLLAVAIDLFGDRAALYLNPALALVALLLLFRLAHALRGRAFALAAAALLAFNVVQVWNSRFSTSEMTAQAILLAGFVFLEEAFDRGDATAGALAGLAFGLAPMATVTTVLVVPFALAAVIWPGGEASRTVRAAFVAALSVALAHLACWSVLVDPKYLAQVIRFFPGTGPWLAAGFVLTALLALVGWKIRSRPELIPAGLRRASAPTLAVLFLLGLAWFRWGSPGVNAAGGVSAIGKLAWFLTPWVLVAFACGGAFLLARERKRTETAFLLAGIAMLFFFLYEPRMYPVYPFTLRRYTPLAVPVIAYAAAVLPAGLLQAARAIPRAAGAVLLALALAVPLDKNRDLLRRSEYAGMGALLADVDSRLPRGGILLCEGRFLAAALEHFAGRRVVILDRVEPERAAGILEFVRRRLAAGEQVSLLSHAEAPWSDMLLFEPIFSRRFVSSRREQELRNYPSSVREIALEFTGYRITPLGTAAPADTFPARVDLGENALGLGPGFSVAKPIGTEGVARWTGAVAELAVPWPAGHDPVEVAIRLASGERRSAPARVRVYLDGTALAEEIVVPAGMTELRFRAAAAAVPRARRVLRISSTTSNPDEVGIAGFPRGLGVLVDWVEIRPLHPGAPGARGLPGSAGMQSGRGERI